ncbi:hypothetical protein Efla_001752 [Eimeria flavescens]
MSEAGWLGGWLPRVLQPFASASVGKRKTPCLSETNGAAHSHTLKGGDDPSKRQKLASSAAARDKQPLHRPCPVTSSPPQTPLQPTSQQLQQRFRKCGLQSSQQSQSRIGRRRLPAGRAQGCFASVPSEDEAAKVHDEFHRNWQARRANRPLQIPSQQSAAAGQTTGGRRQHHHQHQQQLQQQQQQQHQPRSVPSLPLHQLQQKQPFPSLLAPSRMLLEPSRHVRQGGASGKGFEAATAIVSPSAAAARIAGPQIAAKAEVVGSATSATALGGASVSWLFPRNLFRSKGPSASSASTAACTVAAAATGPPSASVSASALPALPLSSAPFTVKSHSTSALPPLSLLGSRQQPAASFLPQAAAPSPKAAALKDTQAAEAEAVKAGARQVEPAVEERLTSSREDTAAFDAPKGLLFASPSKDDATTARDAGGGFMFGHRVLRPLLSKDPAENYDAFLDILRHAQKHCDAEALDILLSDQELQYYTRGSCHPNIALNAQQQQQQQQLRHSSRQLQRLAGARPSWALPGALLSALEAQKTVDPFSVFGEAPSELVLHEVYGQEHYNATSSRMRATHPVLARLEKQGLLNPPAGSSNKGSGSNSSMVQPQPVAGAAADKAREKASFLSAETWRNVVLPSLLQWWQRDSSVELDWRHDPLTAEDCAWYLQAIGATRDLTDVVTLKQPCFCPTPPPQRGWSWTDSRQMLRRRLAGGASVSSLRGRVSVSPSPSPTKARPNVLGDQANRMTSRMHFQLQQRASASRLRAVGASAALSPITPGVRRQRQRKWAEAAAGLTVRSRSRKKSRFFSPVGSPAAVPAPSVLVPAPAAQQLSPPKTAAANHATAGRAAAAQTQAAVKHQSTISAELGRLLADAQRRLDSLAERMRSRSRPPLNAAATRKPIDSRERPLASTTHISSSSHRTVGGTSSARTMSASGGVARGHSFLRGREQGVVSFSSSRMEVSRAASGAVCTAPGGRLADDSRATPESSYYSSSHLPLLGRERVPMSSSAAAATGPRLAGGPTRSDVRFLPTRDANVSPAVSSDRRQWKGGLSDGLPAGSLSSRAAVFAA